MAPYSYILFVFLPLTLLSPLCFCESGFSVQLIHRDSPDSPFYNPSLTHFENIKNSFHRSFNRVNHFYPEAKKSSRNTPQSQIVSNQGEYLVKYSIGTPPFDVMGIVDTGSDLIWSQCKPCDECYNQTSPMFDPSKSATYVPISCFSEVCDSLDQTSCVSADNPNCQYTMSYGDGSQSQGNLAFDTITLGSTQGSSVAFPKIPIGCGMKNAGTFDEIGSGIVGLGGGAVSLITQIGPQIGYKFSYCLVPLLESKTTSDLNFGENALVGGSSTVSTPIAQGSVDTFYFLTLEAISVGHKRIDYVGYSTSNVKGNIIIDSGTTLTILPEDLYRKLEWEVASHIKLKRVRNELLNLCYESANNSIEAPIITMHFSGADVVLRSVNTFVSVANHVTCFAFGSTVEGAIFGNVAQMNFLVGFDLQKKIVSFQPAHCSKL